MLLLLTGCIDVAIKHTDPDTSLDDCATAEVPYDGADNDCDAATPDDDLDGDGFALADDCDDEDADVGGDEFPYDGYDNDCDPSTPDDDLDGDGYGRGDDCDDGNATINPAAPELCNGVDDDCDGAIDTGATDAGTTYADADGDGYGDPASGIAACDAPTDRVPDATDCDDANTTIHPMADELCDGVDDNCDGATDEGGVCPQGYGGHRIDKDGKYYYALYNDRGFGTLGTSDWYGSSDSASAPEGVTWNEDQSVLYYNDLAGNVFAQSEPFGGTSTHIGSFGVGQVGGGVVKDGVYYVGDYTNGAIHAMDVTTGATSLYASYGGAPECKPYFGNNSMAIDTDGTVYAASSCGIVAYTSSGSRALNSYTGLLSITAMDASQELYALDSSGRVVHFDKATGAELGHITIAVTPSTTWTMAVDENGDFVVNYWGEQRLYSHVDGSVITTWSASSWYPGSSGYYWYVTF